MLVGEGGIGKTRTVEEFVRRAAVAGPRVIWGRCPEQGGAPAYWPWRQVIRRHVDEQPAEALRHELGDAAAEVAALVPELRERLDVPDVAAEADADQARFRLLDGVARFLARAALPAPLVVVLDDLHWADQASLALLDFVGREVRTTRLLVVGTYRDVEMRRMTRLSGALARVSQRLELRGLDRAEVERFVAASAGGQPPDGLVDRLHETTEGNPFFLGELVESLRSGGGLEHPPAALRLPDGIRDATRQRLEPLTDDERRVLEVAAVAGRDFSLAPLQAACELSPEALLGRLAGPARAGLVEQAAGRVGQWRFTHALIRETLYHDVLPATRAGLHQRIARALEASAGEGVDAELAHHYYHAAPLGEVEKAIDWGERAGAQAVGVFAYDEAVVHYERALAAQSLRGPDAPRRLALLQALGEAASRQGDDAKASDAFERAARVARTLGARKALVRAALGLARVTRVVAGHVDQRLVAVLEEALAALAPDDDRLRAALLGRLAGALHFDTDPAPARAFAVEAVAVARRAGDPGAVAAALLALVSTFLGPHPVAERAALVEEAVRFAAAAGHPGLALSCRSWRIVTLLEAGEIGAAEAELASFAAEAERQRSPVRRWYGTMVRASIDLLRGRLAEAGRGAADALALRQGGHDPNVRELFCFQMYHLHREQLGFETMEAPIAALARENPGTRLWLEALALIHAEEGQEALARAELEVIAARDFADLPTDGTSLVQLVLLAELVSALGDADRARLLYPLLRPHEDRNVTMSIGGVCHGSAARYVGLLAATAGDGEAAAAHFERALAANQRMGALPQVARTQADLARLLLRRAHADDAEHARELLERARETAAALGMHRFRHRLQALAVAAPPAPALVVRGALRRTGDVWTVGLGEESGVVRHAKGLQYLAVLLSHPGREFHVLELAREDVPEQRSPAGAAELYAAGLVAADLGDAGALLDGQARTAYERRLSDLRDELGEAERFNDPDRAERARGEIEFLSGELSRAVGLGGRMRRAASAAERARVNVTRVVGHALRKIGEVSPAAGEHLAAAVRTGLFCSYQPSRALGWDVQA